MKNNLNCKIISLIITLFVSMTLHAQNAKITISGRDMTIKQAFEQFEAQSKYTIAYSSAKLNVQNKIRINVKEVDVKEALEQILKNTGVTYKINGSHLIIVNSSPKSQLNPSRQQDLPRQTIRGMVKDAILGSPIPYANVVLSNVNPQIGTTTDSLGYFRFENMPIGRYDVYVSSIGYKSSFMKEILLISAKEAYCDIFLIEDPQMLDEVVVKANVNKERTLNPMILTGGRMISVEEANRYAGGLDDPARLATSFAGVAGTPGTNAISIRGNSPQALQWRLEGVEIPNPTHFADIAGVGGGLFSGLSSQVMGNSDFLTGAFSAEYSNALSGVFDLSLRNGNNEKYEHAFQVGVLGLDIASEGPINKKSRSSYIFNYRYSTTGFMGAFVDNIGISFQDLTFKLNFPTRKAGTFSVWGISLIDVNKVDALEERSEWGTYSDRQKIKMGLAKAAGGITHRSNLNNGAYFKTSLSATYSDNQTEVDQLLSLNSSDHVPVVDMKNSNLDIVLNSYFNKRYSSRHTNRSGITVTGLLYDLDYSVSLDPANDRPMERIAKGGSEAAVISAYSNSVISLTDKLIANVGVNTQFFTLNSNWTVEPRLSLKWNFNPKQSLSVAYGLHNRRERLDYYYIKTAKSENNKDLDLAKAHHLVLAYDLSISENIYLKIEPYYQALFDIPVEPGTSFSIINHDNFYLERQLVNKGKGRNYGIDITLERYLNKGYYYMFTGSIFKSEYLGGDNVWRDTRFDRGYMFKTLGGKEWMCGKNKQNIFNLNLRLSYQGGDRYTPIDEAASLVEKDIVYDETQAFSKQFSPAFTADLGVSYKINKKRISHEFGLQLMNITGYTGQHGYLYSETKNIIEKIEVGDMLPNITYKILF